MDITGDIVTPVTDATKADGTEIFPDKELPAERDSNTMNIVVTDMAGNDSVMASDTIELVPFVTVGTTSNTSPIWDVTLTTTLGSVEHSIQAVPPPPDTDGIVVNFQDGTGDFLISDAICNDTPDPVCTWTCVDADTCNWSLEHIWGSITEGGATNNINAKLVDDDSLPIGGNVADLIEGGTNIVDDNGETINTQPQQITWTRNSLVDLGRNAVASPDTTFTWGSALTAIYTAESIAGQDTSPTGSLVKVDGQAVTFTGTILEEEAVILDGLTNDGNLEDDSTLPDTGDKNSASITKSLKVEGPDGITPVPLVAPFETLQIAIDSVDYTNVDLRDDLVNQIHETDKIFNTIRSPPAGKDFSVSGLIFDLDAFDNRHDGVLGATLSDELVTYFGHQVPDALGVVRVAPPGVPLTTTDLNGIIIQGAVSIGDFITNPGGADERTDRAIFLEEGSRIFLPLGVDKVIFDFQNVLVRTETVELSAIHTGAVVPLEKLVAGAHASLARTFAQPEFEAVGKDITEIIVGSLQNLPDGVAVSRITLQNSAHNPATLFTGTMDGMTEASSSIEKGFDLLPSFEIFPGIFYDKAPSTTTPTPSLPVSASSKDLLFPHYGCQEILHQMQMEPHSLLELTHHKTILLQLQL